MATPYGTRLAATKTPLDSYSCRHGLGYTILEGKKDGVTARQELFVPKGDACELDRVTVCNGSTVVKELDLFSYVEFCLWDAVDDGSNFQRNYSTGEVEVEGSVIYHKTEYRERRNHYALFTVNTPIDGFDTSRDAFLGAWRSNANPEVVETAVAPTLLPTAGHPLACIKSMSPCSPAKAAA